MEFFAPLRPFASLRETSSGSARVSAASHSANCRQYLVAKGQDIPGDPRGGVGQKRQQVDLGVPKVVPFVGLSGEAFRRHAGVFRPRGGLQNVKKVEADRWIPRCCALCGLL